MAHFLAVTAPDLVDALESEFKQLDIKKYKKTSSGISFEGSWMSCYKANLMLRTATRVFLPILDFSAYSPEELYKHVRKHDFTKYIKPHQTMAVHVSGVNHKFKDERYTALKIKDAVVDQFRDKFGVRPDIDRSNADLNLYVRLKKSEFSISIDTSGESLSHRGYREESVEAPLREHIAAALIQYLGWDPELPLVDPMCGSGTFLIEAAFLGLGLPSRLKSKRYAFESFINFDSDAWDKLLNESYEFDADRELQLYGFDKDIQAVKSSKVNARKAKLGPEIEFDSKSIHSLKNNWGDKGFLIINPPYGDRLGEEEKLKEFYYVFGSVLKAEFKGWRVGILSGNPELSKSLQMKTTKKFPIKNGPIDCKFLVYDIF